MIRAGCVMIRILREQCNGIPWGKHECPLAPLAGVVMRLSCSSLAKSLGQEASRGRLDCFVYIIGLGLDGLPLVYEVEWRNSITCVCLIS